MLHGDRQPATITPNARPPAPLFVAHTLLRSGLRGLPEELGERTLQEHLASSARQPRATVGRNRQDYAVAHSVPHGVVLAVADGVSITNDEGRASLTEVGAYLVASAAARGALSALAGGEATPDSVELGAATALCRVLRPIWAVEGQGAYEALATTLLLGVATPHWTAIWLHGDGVWGVSVARGGAVHRFTNENATGPGCYRVGVRHAERIVGIARYTASGVSATRQAMELVVHADTCAGLWIATDGLLDEADLLRKLLWPVPELDTLAAALQRPVGCDDLAIAVATNPGAAHGKVR